MRLALYEPDIPQNTGAIMRLCACFAVPLDVIEPCGFILSDKNLKRAGMDYIGQVDMARHSSWKAFNAARRNRLVLLTTKSDRSYLDFQFEPGDILMAGRESAGVPDDVHNACDARITIPMAAGARSLNVAMACAIVLGEALRQSGNFQARFAK
ncbi:MAG TPA: tRNA (cytidine(34)-2'-O)-methyltransferase [Patescibacteria group bacterium]|nr:tRNA (cytidine(34)-2'-O)-methyltransferase [Patescibacteria group bacterium]